MTDNSSEIIFLKDSEWTQIDSEVCRILDFVPTRSIVKDGKVVAPNMTTPYASIIFECIKFPNGAMGYITNKIDFIWSF